MDLKPDFTAGTVDNSLENQSNLELSLTVVEAFLWRAGQLLTMVVLSG